MAVAEPAAEPVIRRGFSPTKVSKEGAVQRWTLAVALFAGVFVSASTPGAADVRIRSSSGGEVGTYLTLFELVRRSGDRVIIDGPCLSACTLVLSIVPRQRICVTGRAVLGFHAAIEVDQYGNRYPASAATRVIGGTYPPPVRSWLNRRGGLSHKLLLLYGRELRAMFPSCG